MSDHFSVELIPAYRPLICRTKPTTRTIQVWTEEASSALQDCFEYTDWGVFKEEGADLEEFTSSVLSYISFCTDAVLPTKTITVFPNEKPWVDSTVMALLKARDGDGLACSRARKELKKKKGIQLAKFRYKRRIEEHFNDNNLRNMWKGIRTMTDYKSSNQQVSRDPTLPDIVNLLF